jgi:hypothetical protein
MLESDRRAFEAVGLQHFLPDLPEFSAEELEQIGLRQQLAASRYARELAGELRPLLLAFFQKHIAALGQNWTGQIFPEQMHSEVQPGPEGDVRPYFRGFPLERIMSMRMHFDICLKPFSTELLTALDDMVKHHVHELEKRSAVWAEVPSISVHVQDYAVDFFIYGLHCGDWKLPEVSA